jgi:hypothetical protein|tara:strand:+ start:352 stop:543 length:192 start_codon:yes stop_codon:yes gene_type:complete
MSKAKQIDIIREKCELEGLNIYEVFREAKVPVVTISNWNRKEPDAFKTIEEVNQAIERLKQKK